MPNVVMKVNKIPPFEFYINNGRDGKIKHSYNVSTEYYINFPDNSCWSVGAGSVINFDDIYNEKVNIYRLKSDKDFDIASANLLNSEWIYTNYIDIPTVEKGISTRDVYVLHYRMFNELYLTSESSDPNIDNLFNVAIRTDESSHIDNWLVYCESDKKWYEFNPRIQNRKNEVIGWVKSPYKLDINEITIAD